MVQTDRSTIFVIGGRQDYYVSNQVWIVNPEKEFQIIQSENLTIAREGSCCGKMIINGTMIVVVAGGWGEDSVEILINPRANKIWQFGNFAFSEIYSLVVIFLHKYFFSIGPRLPMQLVGASMITSPNGKGVILVGGFNHSAKTYSNALIELTGSDIEDLKWTMLEHSPIVRERHVAIQISDLNDFN